MRHGMWIGSLLVWVGCTATEPNQPTAFDHSGGEARVVLAADGFGTLDGERMPLEAIVLRLRLRTRAMAPEQLRGFVVWLFVPAEVADAAAERRVMESKERMVLEIDIMGVRQLYLRQAGSRA